MIDGRKAFTIARTNMRRTVQDPRVAFFALVLPLAIILLVGLLFGGTLRRLPTGVIDDGGGSPIRAALAKEPAIRVKTYHSLATLRRDVRRGRVTAGVQIPADANAPLVFVSQPGRVETVTVRAALETATTGGAATAPVVIRTVRGIVERTTPSPYAYTSAANLVLFTFVNSLAMSVALVSTRELGVTERMLATPTSSSTIVFGELLGRFAVAATQAIALLALGKFVFGVDWGDPAAVAALVGLFVLVSSAAGLLIGTLASSQEQAISMAIPIGVGLGMLGGCMWTLDIVGPLMRGVGHITPHAWAMDGFIKVVLAQDSIGRITKQLAVLAAFAAALLVVATRRMRRIVAR